MDPIQQLRGADFVILQGEKDGKAYKFAKVDSRCSLMNSPKWLGEIEAAGARVVAVGK